LSTRSGASFDSYSREIYIAYYNPVLIHTYTGIIVHGRMKINKATLYILPIVLLVPFRGHAQDYPVIDSLKNVLETAEEDTTMFQLLIDLGNQYTFLLPDSAVYYFEAAREISENLDSPEFLALSLRNIGIAKENQGLYDQALEAYFGALAVITILPSFTISRNPTTCASNISQNPWR